MLTLLRLLPLLFLSGFALVFFIGANEQRPEFSRLSGPGTNGSMIVVSQKLDDIVIFTFPESIVSGQLYRYAREQEHQTLSPSRWLFVQFSLTLLALIVLTIRFSLPAIIRLAKSGVSATRESRDRDSISE